MCSEEEIDTRKNRTVSSVTQCEEICDEIPTCSFFTVNPRSKCQVFEQCDASKMEKAAQRTIYKKIEGKLNNIFRIQVI